MRSDLIKEGPSRAPHRSLLRALGIDELEMKRPFIAVVNSKSDYIPGHMHLDKIAEQVKAGIRNAGGVPFEFNTIGEKHTGNNLVTVRDKYDCIKRVSCKHNLD